MTRILIIGATGNFGKRLTRLLSSEDRVAVILAGRRLAPLHRLQAELGGGEAIALDRNDLGPELLKKHRIDIVIDASGPFIHNETNVIEAALQAGAHYIDIADNRDFVLAIDKFNQRAIDAGVHVITGASSTPGLSGSVVQELTRGWKQVDRIRVAIAPSNRQPRGRAVVESILASVGQKLKIFRNGRWETGHGWGDLRRIDYPGVGRRWASIVPTPDIDLLVKNHHPVISAEFFASLELPLLHLGTAALGRLVRANLIKTLQPFAGPLKWVADRLEPFGNDMGGMIVEAEGINAENTAVKSRWWLFAKGDIGPHVPILGALECVRKIRDGALGEPGAKAAAGLLRLTDYQGDFDALDIQTGREFALTPGSNLFFDAMEKDFGELPEITQRLHSPESVLVWQGSGNAVQGKNIGARILARLFRFPKPVKNAEIRVIIERKPDGSENWSRIWPDAVMRSVMKNPDSVSSIVEEHFGPFAFSLKLKGSGDGVDMQLVSGRLFGIALPKIMLPDIQATERAKNQCHLFDVKVSLPVIGLLTHYHGWLKPV